MRKIFILMVAMMGFALPSQAQTLLGYWDLNDNPDSYPGMTPIGTLNAGYLILGDGYLDYNSDGTEENLPSGLTPPAVAGQSLAFSLDIGVVDEGYIEITGINFTGYKDVTFSFAGMKTTEEDLFTSFSIEYRYEGMGVGWTTAADLDELPEAFDTISHAFGSTLNGKTNAAIRIHFVNILEADEKVLFDNIQIGATAVPEPQTALLLGVAVAGGFAWRRLRIA